MTNERLEELKKYVMCIRTNGWISLTKSDDLLALIDQAIDRADVMKQFEIGKKYDVLYGGVNSKAIAQSEPNNFERWKAQLTMKGMALHVAYFDTTDRCNNCPANAYCETNPILDEDCEDRFKEWGEQHE